ncbi:unnamed protein product [Brassicogethes aeneus]|uniref:Uncharacterized protein n=1 Tax=Brassicogethes aeneus TaxID=1431903 RepID=A0A9P0ASX9_BRAAE|nr:unnamed protein product [Brassicogethes aeneus]
MQNKNGSINYKDKLVSDKTGPNKITATQLKNEIEKVISNINKESAENIENDGFKKVTYKKKTKPNTTKGTAEQEETENFKACPSKMWLYIGRVSEGVEEVDVINYIKKKCNTAVETDIVVSQLSTIGKAKSFKVGISNKYHENLNQASFWPANIIIRRFNFWAHKKNSEEETANFSKPTEEKMN